MHLLQQRHARRGCSWCQAAALARFCPKHISAFLLLQAQLCHILQPWTEAALFAAAMGGAQAPGQCCAAAHVGAPQV
jgi:hypothetical protein